MVVFAMAAMTVMKKTVFMIMMVLIGGHSH